MNFIRYKLTVTHCSCGILVRICKKRGTPILNHQFRVGVDQILDEGTKSDAENRGNTSESSEVPDPLAFL
jgi:hypothetical protein